MKKKITVDLTISWTFDEKDWTEEKDHLEEIRNNPKIIVRSDLHHTIHCLNDITIPELKDHKVYYVD
tara:strand:+ start:977 stop:1177 length:201 start_codon:yes stop_codon:yes gene_type:complete